ncbi:hypothetical protein HQ489_00245 [Candidatus Woesearchaeota archaeon]|nr:hypothetical protein [Candidatus Woesearchaeota archaeon]
MQLTTQTKLELDLEQQYVMDHAKLLGLEPKLIYHSKSTSTCQEKLDLLQETHPGDWTLNQMVKALYFRGHGELWGIITPEEGRIPTEDIFAEILGIKHKKAKGYRPCAAERLPLHMEPGTCTPFPLASSMGYEITGLIVLNKPELQGRLVDISVGGIHEKSHRTSMHLPYDAIHSILKAEFDDYVHLWKQQ